MPETTFGVIYPDPSEPVAEGAARIRDVAEALDSRVLAGRLDWGPAGAPADASLYRASAGAVKTDGYLVVGGSVVVDTTDAANRVYFGSAFDTSLYRAAAYTLKTDGVLNVAGTFAAKVGTAAQVALGDVIVGGYPAIAFGAAADTALYRSAAGVLSTDGQLAAGSLKSAGPATAASFGVPSGTPGGWLDLGQVGATPAAPGFAAGRLYVGSSGAKNVLMVVWPDGSRTQVAIQP